MIARACRREHLGKCILASWRMQGCDVYSSVPPICHWVSKIGRAEDYHAKSRGFVKCCDYRSSLFAIVESYVCSFASTRRSMLAIMRRREQPCNTCCKLAALPIPVFCSTTYHLFLLIVTCAEMPPFREPPTRHSLHRGFTRSSTKDRFYKDRDL